MGQWIGLCQIITNWINLDLIKIIQFCLKINLLRHVHTWIVVCVERRANVWDHFISLKTE